MSNWQRKARPGEALRIPAAAYNAFVDAAVANRRGALYGKDSDAYRPADTIDFINEGEMRLPPYFVVRLGVFANQPFRYSQRPVFKRRESTLSLRQTESVVAVTVDHVGPYETGRAAISGACFARCARSLTGQQLLPGTKIGSRFAGLFGPDSHGSAVVLSPGFLQEAGFAIHLVRLGVPSGVWLAKLDMDPTQIGNEAKWSYAWEEVSYTDTGQTGQTPNFETFAGARTSVTTGEAWNLLEQNNTAAIAYGMPVAGENFEINNTGVRFRPVPTDTIVEMWMASDRMAGTRWRPVFSAPNAVYGPCVSQAALDALGSYLEELDSGTTPFDEPVISEEIDEFYDPLANEGSA